MKCGTQKCTVDTISDRYLLSIANEGKCVTGFDTVLQLIKFRVQTKRPFCLVTSTFPCLNRLHSQLQVSPFIYCTATRFLLTYPHSQRDLVDCYPPNLWHFWQYGSGFDFVAEIMHVDTSLFVFNVGFIFQVSYWYFISLIKDTPFGSTNLHGS
jgi:hypothetical protein